MDGDDLSDDVFIDRHVINRDELRVADGQIPTIPISSGAKAGGGVLEKDEEEVRIYAPLDYDDSFRRHENYFYPEDDQNVSEGWRSYKIEDEEPFGPISGGPPLPQKHKNNNHSSSTYFNHAKTDPSTKANADFDDTVTHKVSMSTLV